MDAITNLKIQVISEFNKYLQDLAVGKNVNYDMILHKMSFIQTYGSFDKIDPVYEYLINN